jgi:hypothetical protein
VIGGRNVMSDLIIETTYVCASTQNWSIIIVGTRGDEYTVTFGPAHNSVYQYEWGCTCNAGRFGRKCKHVAEARSRWCGWNAEADPGLRPDRHGESELACPSCGGPVVAVRVGV